jgi:predicted transcriptional regulator
MRAVTITLSDDGVAKLRELAAQRGLSTEDFLRTCVERWLEQPGTESGSTPTLSLR